MKRERGIISPELIVGGISLVVLLAVIGGAVLYVQHAESAAYKSGHAAGISEEKGRWQTRENEELVAANGRIHDLEEEKRALERKSVDDVQAAAMKLQKTIKEKDDEKERALEDARTGAAFGLRWSPSPAASETADGSAGAAPGAATAGAAGNASCGLPQYVTDALISEAVRADKVVAERNAAVEIAVKDREVCGK